MQIPSSGSIFSALGSLTGTATQPRPVGDTGQAAPARPTAPVQHLSAIRQSAAIQSAPTHAGDTPPPTNLPRGSLLNIKV